MTDNNDAPLTQRPIQLDEVYKLIGSLSVELERLRQENNDLRRIVLSSQGVPVNN